MRTSLLYLTLCLAFLAVGTAARADDKIWVGLYFAENNPPPENAKLAPERLHHRLKQVFGFHHYELVDGQEIDLRHEWAHWVIPRKDFFLRVEPMGRAPGEPRHIYYEIYKDGFIVAKGRYEANDETPLFINGPDFKQGRFIYVMEKRDGDD